MRDGINFNNTDIIPTNGIVLGQITISLLFCHSMSALGKSKRAQNRALRHDLGARG
jgi:hypothetical protein